MIDRIKSSRYYPTFAGWFVATFAVFIASCTIVGMGVFFGGCVKIAGWLL